MNRALSVPMGRKQVPILNGLVIKEDMSRLKYDLQDDILWVTLADPEAGNAFSPAMAAEFHKLRQSHAHQALIVQNEGRFFCAGGNLRHYQSLKSKEEGLQQNQEIKEILSDLENSSVPTLALVDGIVLGGGIEFLSAFHQIIATPSSLFGLWQRRIGLTFGWGGQARLQQRIGPVRTRQWLNSGKTHSAWMAQDMGLVDAVVLRESLTLEGRKVISEINEMGGDSFAQIQANKNDQDVAFKKLWLSGRHKKVLSQF